MPAGCYALGLIGQHPPVSGLTSSGAAAPVAMCAASAPPTGSMLRGRSASVSGFDARCTHAGWMLALLSIARHTLMPTFMPPPMPICTVNRIYNCWPYRSCQAALAFLWTGSRVVSSGT
jgi:hypothetical protein